MRSPSVFRNGEFLNVHTPRSDMFIQAARALRGRYENGKWIFLRSQERSVNKVLCEIFGHAGSETRFHDVQISLRPHFESVDATLEIAGVHILQALNEHAGFLLNPRVKIQAGEFIYLPKGPYLSPRIRVGKHGVTLVLKNLAQGKFNELVSGKHDPWITSLKHL